MKTIFLINWGIIATYAIVIIGSILGLNRPGMDAAGRGMAQGFLMIGAFFTLLLIGLNLVPIKWVRIVVLLLGGMPLMYFIINSFISRAERAQYMEQAKKARLFEGDHLNAIMEAIRYDKTKAIKQLLEKDDSNINHVGATNLRTLLDIAIQHAAVIKTPESKEIVELLLMHKADPNVHHPKAAPPYVKFATICPIALFDSLFAAGADPNATDENGIPVIFKLVEHASDHHYEKIEILLKHGADPNIAFGDEGWELNFNPLIFAAGQKGWKSCELLINYGADVNFKPPGEVNDFWYHFEKAGIEYQKNGTIPEAYRSLAANPKVKSRKE